MWISPAKPRPSSKRKIFMNIKDSHNSRAKSLRWDWRILFRMLSGKKNSIHKEWKGCHSQILPPSPPSVCHAVSFSHSVRLTVSFFMTLRRDTGEHWNMITLLLNHFSQPILLLLITITSDKTLEGSCWLLNAHLKFQTETKKLVIEYVMQLCLIRDLTCLMENNNACKLHWNSLGTCIHVLAFTASRRPLNAQFASNN